MHLAFIGSPWPALVLIIIYVAILFHSSTVQNYPPVSRIDVTAGGNVGRSYVEKWLAAIHFIGVYTWIYLDVLFCVS